MTDPSALREPKHLGAVGMLPAVPLTMTAHIALERSDDPLDRRADERAAATTNAPPRGARAGGEAARRRLMPRRPAR